MSMPVLLYVSGLIGYSYCSMRMKQLLALRLPIMKAYAIMKSFSCREIKIEVYDWDRDGG